jgi:hypothetical protein
MINIFYQCAFVGLLRKCKYSSLHECGTYKVLLLSQESCKLNLVLAMSRGDSVVEALRYKTEGRGIDSGWCHWNFSLTSFRPHYGPGVDSTCNRNEYQGYFLGLKVAGA